MEEAVWGPIQEQKESTLVRVSDSNSTSKTYQRKRNVSVLSKTKITLSVVFNSLAIAGWVATFVLFWDAFFNSAKIISFLLAGH